MGAAEEELCVESEMAKRGEAAAAEEGKIAECDLSAALKNPALKSASYERTTITRHYEM